MQKISPYTLITPSVTSYTSALPSSYFPLNLCEVYLADSLSSARKCVETHPWRQHFCASAPHNTTNNTNTNTNTLTHTHTPSLHVNICIFCSCLCLLVSLYPHDVCIRHLLYINVNNGSAVLPRCYHGYCSSTASYKVTSSM